MKQLIFLLVILCVFACKDDIKKKVKSIDSINAKQLLLIIKDSSLESFRKLVNTTGYDLLDSGDTKNGSIFYIAEEPKELGNVLSASLTKSFNVNFLHFSTYEEELFQHLKQQFVDLGFKSSGNSRGTEEFKQDNIYISTVGVKESYNVMLVREK